MNETFTPHGYTARTETDVAPSDRLRKDWTVVGVIPDATAFRFVATAADYFDEVFEVDATGKITAMCSLGDFRAIRAYFEGWRDGKAVR